MVSFLHSFMENISDLTECNVLFINEHLILIGFFLLIETEFDLKITFRRLNPENSDQEPSYNMSKNLLLLPRILKLIKDMVDDSTPLFKGFSRFGDNSDLYIR